MRRRHEMPFGAHCAADATRFRLWAPGAKTVEVVLGAAEPYQASAMTARADGWFEAEVPGVAAGQRYAFRIDGGTVVPDPASRANPHDVHASSQVVDPEAFDWSDTSWRGRPWHEAVVYELHVGTFTPEGTFSAAIGRLDDLVALGVTAIELMPVADFAGSRGWGYDGVLPYAPEASYGTPDELKQLVAQAHARGLMVLIDVVYNHFGPDGNYLHVYASSFFDPQVHTPWGAGVRLSGQGSRAVRDFFIHNALYWIEEFHVDGLRLDAVHAMHDASPLHLVDELAQAVRQGPGRTRHVHLVLENDLNQAAHLVRSSSGEPTLSTAQWNDDVHHAVHVLVTGETDGYYVDYAEDPVGQLGRALAEGFAYQGDPSRYRDGERRGTPSRDLPPLAFVNSLQTHDQVGNRAMGERLGMLAAAQGREPALRALTACVLLAPAVPMLFMGEEYAAATPFLYFCDFTGELAQAVTQGRRAEFARFERFADPALRDSIPDPNAEPTFAASRLDWSERLRMPHAAWLSLYRDALAVRHRHLVPWLGAARSGTWSRPTAGTLQLQWPLAQGRRWHLLARLCDDADAAPPALPGETVFASDEGPGLPPWSVRVSLEAR